MATPFGTSEAASAIRTVALESPAFQYPYVATIPGDGLWHTLNEDGLGYFAIGDNPVFEGDRSILSVEFTNRTLNVTAEVGSFDHKLFQSPLPPGASLAPGETRIRGISKLSAIAFRVPAGGDPLVLDVTFVSEDR